MTMINEIKGYRIKINGRRRYFPASVARAGQYSFFKSINKTRATLGYQTLVLIKNKNIPCVKY